MNFLAHLLLADDTPADRIGSILPDLVRGSRKLKCDASLRRAMNQHRRIDVFTDTHATVARSKARLFEAHGRFTGILVDVFYDHILSREWSTYCDTPRETFIAEVYQQFDTHEHLMPPAMRLPVQRMIDQDWLGSYATLEGIEHVLTMMSVRFSQRFDREINLAPAVHTLRSHRDALTRDFHEFFPMLVAYSRVLTESSTR